MLPEGKLDITILKELLANLGATNSGIVSGPAAGRDTAIFDLIAAKKYACEFYGCDLNVNCLCVLKSDPITFPTTNPGKYAVIINANDLATAGAIPYGFLVMIIAPPNTNQDEIFTIQREIDSIAKEKQIAILGGHTEISSAVNSLVVGGFMIGFVPENYCPVNRSIIPGDTIIQIGWTGIEGTSILASKGFSKLKNHMSLTELNTAQSTIEYLDITGTTLMLNHKYQLKLIHDCTEGGVLGGLYEMLHSLELGADISGPFPIMNETLRICQLLNVNPLRLISSGTFFCITSHSVAEALVKENLSIPVRIIGEIRPNHEGITYRGTYLTKPEPDELITGLKNLSDL